MLRKLLILGICAGSSASIPILYQANPEAVEHLLRTALQQEEPAYDIARAEINVVRPASPMPDRIPGRKVEIKVGPHGHFTGDFRLNGRNVGAIIDTGATLVALNMSTARLIGLALTPRDFKYMVNTANGKARAASAVIDRLEIGRIIVEDVKAVVLEDSALTGTLIGASFLNRLARYQVADGSLLLVQ